MGNKFDKLIAAVKVISQGKPTVKPGKFCVDHYEKDWRALLASRSPSSTVGELSLSRIGLRHRREELFFRLELVGNSLAITIFLPSFLCLFLNVFPSFSFWQESPLSRARKFTITTSKSKIWGTTYRCLRSNKSGNAEALSIFYCFLYRF